VLVVGVRAVVGSAEKSRGFDECEGFEMLGVLDGLCKFGLRREFRMEVWLDTDVDARDEDDDLGVRRLGVLPLGVCSPDEVARMRVLRSNERCEKCDAWDAVDDILSVLSRPRILAAWVCAGIDKLARTAAGAVLERFGMSSRRE
jgi:hypothetical protein